MTTTAAQQQLLQQKSKESNWKYLPSWNVGYVGTDDTLLLKSQSSEPTKNDNITANAFPNLNNAGMDIVLCVIALKKLKLGYPVKLTKRCQLWSHIKGKFLLCGSNVTLLILDCNIWWLLSNNRDMRSMSFRFTICSCQMADFVHQVFLFINESCWDFKTWWQRLIK